MAWNKCNTLFGLALILASILGLACGNGLMCSRCNSRNEKIKGECENDPPTPTRCSSSSAVFCITAKELAKDGSLIGFVRDCSTTNNGDQCQELGDSTNPNSPFQICFSTCDYNGCNGSRPVAMTVTWSVLSVVVIAFGLLNNMRLQ